MSSTRRSNRSRGSSPHNGSVTETPVLVPETYTVTIPTPPHDTMKPLPKVVYETATVQVPKSTKRTEKTAEKPKQSTSPKSTKSTEYISNLVRVFTTPKLAAALVCALLAITVGVLAAARPDIFPSSGLKLSDVKLPSFPLSFASFKLFNPLERFNLTIPSISVPSVFQSNATNAPNSKSVSAKPSTVATQVVPTNSLKSATPAAVKLAPKVTDPHASIKSSLFREKSKKSIHGRTLDISPGFADSMNYYILPSISSLTIFEANTESHTSLHHKLASTYHTIIPTTLQKARLVPGFYDTIISTNFGLCGTPNSLQSSLEKVHKMLRENGTFFFMEHGRCTYTLSDEIPPQTYQDVLKQWLVNPVMSIIAPSNKTEEKAKPSQGQKEKKLVQDVSAAVKKLAWKVELNGYSSGIVWGVARKIEGTEPKESIWMDYFNRVRSGLKL